MKIELDSVFKSYGDHRVLNRVNFHSREGRVLAMIGPSGGGKSTLLRLLAGLEIPDEGGIRINGELLPANEAGLLAYRRRVGVVFQAFNLFPHLTARENIELPLREVHGMAADQAEARADELLRRFGLEDRAEAQPARLSGGQRQRVAIARALSAKPSVLFFDEPTSSLDPEMTGEVLEVMEELKAEGKDLVVVTHEMGFARKVADEVLFLAGGRILESAPAGKIFDRPETPECRRFLDKVLKY